MIEILDKDKQQPNIKKNTVVENQTDLTVPITSLVIFLKAFYLSGIC